jgi:hypothetical protein
MMQWGDGRHSRVILLLPAQDALEISISVARHAAFTAACCQPSALLPPDRTSQSLLLCSEVQPKIFEKNKLLCM